MAIPELNTTYDQMLNKQNRTVILPKESFENEFDRFIIDATNETGEYIVENALNEMTAQGIDASILVDGDDPEIAEVCYNTKRSETYIYKVREDELKNASASEEAYDALMARINANLDQQDRKNCWREFPKIISRTDGFKNSQFSYGNSATDYANLILAMRSGIAKVKEPTDLYNSYAKTVGTNTYTLKTFTGRPIIFIKSSLLDQIEVNYESGVKNLDKISVDADIVRVPTFYTATYNASTNSYTYVEDTTKLFLVCGRDYAKIYRHFEKRARLEDVRSFNIGKAVTYIEYLSKLVPAIWYMSGAAPTTVNTQSLKTNK